MLPHKSIINLYAAHNDVSLWNKSYKSNLAFLYHMVYRNQYYNYNSFRLLKLDLKKASFKKHD